MAKHLYCPDGCPWLKADTLFTWRCMRCYDAGLNAVCGVMLGTSYNIPQRHPRCVREGLPEGVKEADPC